MATITAEKSEFTPGTPPATAWREDVLLLIMRILAAFVIPPALIDVFILIGNQQYGRVLFNLIIVAVVITLAIRSRFPYVLRLVGLLSSIYLAGSVFVLTGGLVGTGRIYLFELVVVAALLLSRRNTIIVWLITVLTLGLLYSGFAFELLPLPLAIVERMFAPGTLVVSWLGQAIASATVGAAVLLVVQRLQHSLRAAETARAETQRLNAVLEQRVEERTAELRQSEERFRTAVENMLDGFSLFSAVRDEQGAIVDFRYSYVNAAGSRLSELSAADVLGRSFRAVYPHLSERGLFDAYVRVVETGEPMVDDDFAYLSPTAAIPGEQRYFEFRAVKLADGFALTWRDVTERKRSEETLRQQAEALAMLRERERLARELHDDLGQVLGYVATQGQAVRGLLLQGQAAQARESLDALLEVTRESQTDMRAFIRATRSEAAAGGEYSGRSFVAGLTQQLQWFAQVYAIPVTLQAADELQGALLSPLVESHLLRVAQEALTNVRKHAGASQVKVQLALVGRDLQMTIADDGCGFDPAQFTAESDQGDPGAHYGLESMRGRAAELGGELQISSAPRQGTTVTVTVPLQPTSAEPSVSVQAQQGRVLLVDDSPLFATGLQTLLTAHGYTVVGIAYDGRQGIELARRLRPDLILMDLDMPFVNGLEATSRIHADWPDAQIVMLTMLDDDDDVFAALRAGATGYLLKSLDGAELLNRLHGLTQGEAPLSPGLANRVLRAFADQAATSAAADALAALNPTQRAILSLVAEGRSYREVGEELGFSPETIKKYMGRIVRLLQVRNRAEAVAYLRRLQEPGAG